MAALATGSDKLLADSESLFAAFTSFGSLKDTSIVGGVWLSILSGALALFSIAGLSVGPGPRATRPLPDHQGTQ